MKLIDCGICGHRTLGLRTGPGRTVLHRNVKVPVPDDFALPECSTCGSRPIPWKLAEALEPHLEQAWGAQMHAHVAADLEVLGRLKPLTEWQRLLNLSGGYLSKLKGDKTPSAPLVALLRLLANHPELAEEIEALWSGRPLVVRTGVSVAVGTPAPRPPAPLRMVAEMRVPFPRAA